MKRHEITEKQWNRIKDYLPPEKKPHGGRPGKSNRFIFHAILYWLNTEIPWRDLPERFGPWQTVYSRFRTWTLAGVWDEVLSALITEDLVDETTLILADKGYDSAEFIRRVEERGFQTASHLRNL